MGLLKRNNAPYDTFLFRSAARPEKQSPKFRPALWRPLPKSRNACRASSPRSEEHTSELQSLMRSSYAVFCLKKKNNIKHKQQKDVIPKRDLIYSLKNITRKETS